MKQITIKASRETWKPVVGYEKQYRISSFGKLESVLREILVSRYGKKYTKKISKRLMKCYVSSHGYLKSALTKNGVTKPVYIHRLVIEAFKGKNKLYVDHINEDKLDNRIENLQYLTNEENLKKTWKRRKQINPDCPMVDIKECQDEL